MKERLKLQTAPGLLRFYAGVSLGYAALWFLSNHATFAGNFIQGVGNNIWRVVYVAIVNFVFFEYTIPWVLRKRKILLFNFLLGVFVFWVHLMLWSYGLYAWRLLGIELYLYAGLTSFKSLAEGLTAQMAYSAGSVFFFGVCRHLYNHIKLRQLSQQLRIEKQAAELNYLKSQTNPHFLFNTLNNIYALARDKSDEAATSIMQLSKILRYMLYETGGDFVAIEQEVKIIGDYIALEKLRYDDSLRVQFHHDIEDMRQSLPPLLLVPLVENAFKHGVSETRGHPFVDVHLSVKQRVLTFTVLNSAPHPIGDPTVRENIGLSNLRRQLQLLYTNYTLSLQHVEAGFEAKLTIDLSSHT